MSEWQSIASAPRDGTEVLLWVPPSPLVPGHEGYRFIGKWRESEMGDWAGWIDPTDLDAIGDDASMLWQPLPACPTPAAASGTPNGGPA